MSNTNSLSSYLAFAVEAAREAGKIPLEYFQTDLDVSTKPDQSPVTIADKRTEEKLRELILARFPEHGIVGEEFGEHNIGAAHRWIIDPIDGTQSFIRGVGLFGLLLGLEFDGEMIVGVANLPAINEIVFAGKGLGCYWNDRRARVSQISNLSDATLLTTDVRSCFSSGRGEAYERLSAITKLQRTWGDCYGHILVATGRAEIMLDPIMNPWDCAALLPILDEAGGTFTDWEGNATIVGGNAISTNKSLFEDVIRLANSEGTT